MADSPENRCLLELFALIDSGECRPCTGALKVDGDPATANNAIVVVDEDIESLAGVTFPSGEVKDGVVVMAGRRLQRRQPCDAGAPDLPYARAEERPGAGSAGLYPGAAGGPGNGRPGVGMARYPVGKKYLSDGWCEQL